MRTAGKVAAIFVAGTAFGALAAPTGVQAAMTYFHTTKHVTGAGHATCPKGWQLTGGGPAALPPDDLGNPYSYQYQLTGSFPTSTRTWKATAVETDGTYDNYRQVWNYTTRPYQVKVYAICTR